MVTFATQNVLMDPPVHEAGPPPLPEPPHLPRAGAPEAAPAALPLLPEPGRPPLPRRRRDGRRPAGPLHARSPERPGSTAGRGASSRSRRCRSRPRDPATGKERPVPMTVPKPVPDLQALADQVLLQRFAPAGRPRERRGRHPLHQRADGEVPRARRGEGELERLRHGARGAPAGASRDLPSGRRDRAGRPPARASSWRPGKGRPGSTSLAQALTEPEALRGTVMIVFSDVAAPPGPPEGPGARRARPGARRRRRSSASSTRPARRCSPSAARCTRCTRRCRRRRRSSSPRTRSSSRRTRSSSRRTRS